MKYVFIVTFCIVQSTGKIDCSKQQTTMDGKMARTIYNNFLQVNHKMQRDSFLITNVQIDSLLTK